MPKIVSKKKCNEFIIKHGNPETFHLSKTCNKEEQHKIKSKCKFLKSSDIDTFSEAYTQMFKNFNHDVQMTEPLLLMYTPGDYVKYHYDGNQTNYKYTSVLYLNSNKNGGEIDFPFKNMTIQPHCGDMILWDNLNNNGFIDEESLHGVLPIQKGCRLCIVNFYEVYQDKISSHYLP